MSEIEGQGTTTTQNPESAKSAPEVELKIAEQKRLMLENLQNIAGNMMPFSDINLDTPVSEENKKKLSSASEFLQEIHELALQTGGIALGGSLIMELYNQTVMRAGGYNVEPGIFTAMVLGPVAAGMTLAETGWWTAKGIEKMYEGAKRLTSLIRKNKAPGVGGAQAPQTETGVNKM